MELFEKLPPEIRFHILKQNCQVLQISQQISPYYKNLMQKEYYKEFFQPPLEGTRKNRLQFRNLKSIYKLNHLR